MTTWLVDSTAPGVGGVWAGSISTNILTLTSFSAGVTIPTIGNIVSGTGMVAGTTIIGITTPWNGTTGVYTLSNSTSTATGGTIGGTGKSTDGWVNAVVSLVQVISSLAAGDDVNVYSGSANTQAAALTLTFPGTVAAPNRVFSTDRTNAPAQASDLVAGASVTITGANALIITGCVYIWGVTFNQGTGITAASFTLGNSLSSDIFLDNCLLNCNITSAANTISVVLSANATSQRVRMRGCTITFAGSTTSLINFSGGIIRFENCSFVSLNSTLIQLFSGLRPGTCIVDGCDLTVIASGKNIIAALNCSSIFQFINNKLTSGALIPSPSVYGAYVDLIVSDSGATGYRQERYQVEGTSVASTTVYNSATDGVTPISWSISTTANNNHAHPFELFDMCEWVAPGTYAATVINVVSKIALTNADVWVDAHVLDTAGNPQAHVYSSGIATELTAGSTLATGPTWSNPPATPTYYELQVPSFAVTIAGYVRFSVKVAKASIASGNLFIDPDVTVA